MLETRQGTTEDLETMDKTKPPRSLKIAAKGVRTGQDFAALMSALMSDLIEGRLTPNVGNAACNAGGKLLKVVELQYKYGTQNGNQSRSLLLADLGEQEDDEGNAVIN